MESLNLNTLASSLPTAHQNAEKDLLNNFKAAALSITTLYRSSRQNSKRAYNAGYAAACQDLLTMIQQGVSLDPSGSSHDAEGGGMTIGRVMDWTEARLEEIKAREEEEDEDEEREKEKERGPTASTEPKPDDKALAPSRPSPSPQPPTSARPVQRPSKARAPSKAESTSTPAIVGLGVATDAPTPVPSSIPFSDVPIPIAAGAKRRHAMMMMLDSSSSPATSSSPSHPPVSAMGGGTSGTSGALSSRRRTRSSKNLALQQSHNQNISVFPSTSEAMDVEEDGRERKRVARR